MIHDPNPRAVMGANNPPLEAELAPWKARIATVMGDWAGWKSAPLTEEVAAQLNDLITGITGIREEVEARRVELKKPYDDGAKAVQAVFKPHIDGLDLLTGYIKARLAEWTKAERARQAAQREADIASVESSISERTVDLNVARQTGNIAGEQEALRQLEVLERELKALGKSPARVKVASASGGSRSRGLRTVKEVSITNARLAFMQVQNDPAVLEALVAAGNRLIRAKDYDGRDLPGFAITTTEKVA